MEEGSISHQWAEKLSAVRLAHHERTENADCYSFYFPRGEATAREAMPPAEAFRQFLSRHYLDITSRGVHPSVTLSEYSINGRKFSCVKTVPARWPDSSNQKFAEFKRDLAHWAMSGKTPWLDNAKNATIRQRLVGEPAAVLSR
jgi:hypothetical protein